MDGNRHSFLIVDDEPGMLESLRHLFRRDYDVQCAGTGAEAIRVLERMDVHVILSDQRMPGMAGDELLARARQIRPDAVRMLFTGYADMQAVIRAVNEGGIFRYILKPWDPDEIQSVVRQAFAQYDLLAERRRLLAELRDANESLKAANSELAESNQLKSAFLEVASHEFQTPITIVQGLADLLPLLNPERPVQEAAILRQISEAARQLSKLVNNTLQLLEAGDFRPLHLAPTALSPLLCRAAEQVRPIAAARGLKFAVAILYDLGDFEIDADKIRDAVLNLLTNAIKFTPDGGEFTLEAHSVDQGAAAEVVVADHGIGLDARALARLFDPFFTEFDPSRHSSGEYGFGKRGLGLGLSLVKKFVELHGGTVSAASQPGEGTRVVLRVPRHPAGGRRS